MTTKEDAKAALEAIQQNQAEAQASLVAIQQKQAGAQNAWDAIQESVNAAVDSQVAIQKKQVEAQDSQVAIQKKQVEAQDAREAIQQNQAEAQNAWDAIQQHHINAQNSWDAIQQRDTETQAVLEAARQKDAETQAILEAVLQKDAYAQNNLDELKAHTEKLSTANQEALTASQAALEELKSTEETIRSALGKATAAGLTEAFAQAIEAEEKRSRKYWVLGAVIGVLTALFFLVYQQLTAPPQLSLWGYISRAPTVAIPFAVAWFCGSQYIKLENTLGDYRYKKVLAQSMANFMEQLANVDKERRAYLLTLFRQMLQDPLRKKHDVQTPLSFFGGLLNKDRKDKPDDDLVS